VSRQRHTQCCCCQPFHFYLLQRWWPVRDSNPHAYRPSIAFMYLACPAHRREQ
jgi:hypothetical protein